MSNKRKFHLVFGVSFFSLGLYGIYSEIFNVVDFIKGVMQPVLILLGMFIDFVGLQKESTTKLVYITVGVITIGLGLFGLYDEWYTVVDLLRGILPPICMLFGALALVNGINKLRT